ncbi:MAG TPA: DMT family transporter [Bacteroidales bacterium]|nr:DMT family transporter [Bacteroidales bacterium]HSA42633.1 DMT family transporter [Bacteroidales bacterium]
MKANRTLVTTAAVLSMFFWGMSFVWSKVVFEYYSPLSTIFIRLLLSSLLLIMIWQIFIREQKIKRKDAGLFLLSAFFSPFCYFIGESYGLQRVSSTIASVIIATIPVFTPFTAWLFLRERLSVLNFAGLFISFVGVLVMLLNKDLTLNASLSGVGLLLFAVFSALGYGILIRKLSLRYHPVVIVAVQNLLGAVYFLPFFLYLDLSHVLHTSLTFNLVYSMAALFIFASSAAFILYTYVIKHLGIARSNIYSNLIPVFTAVFSYFILSEQMTFAKWTGMLIVIGGVVIAQSGKLFLNMNKAPGENAKQGPGK